MIGFDILRSGGGAWGVKCGILRPELSAEGYTSVPGVRFCGRDCPPEGARQSRV